MAQALNPLCEVGKHLEHALEGVMPASNSQSSFTLSVLQKREHCSAYSSPMFNLPDSKSGTIECVAEVCSSAGNACALVIISFPTHVPAGDSLLSLHLFTLQVASDPNTGGAVCEGGPVWEAVGLPC
jgi:hypothetical protein